VFNYYGFSRSLIPEIRDVFSEHGQLTTKVAGALSLRTGIPVTYKAGDQPNNALSLNVLEPGEVAATAGTSGVIYGVSDQLAYDHESRINTFAHVNYTREQRRLGVLLCINGTGILNRWVKNISGDLMGYAELNNKAAAIAPGSEGVMVFPFGNGAERMLNNRVMNAQFLHIDFNKHGIAHVYRAAQEGIVFAFRYGLDIMRQNGMQPGVIRAGKANMFLSEVFTSAFVNTLNVPVELYQCDGSHGAAIGSGIGAGFYKNPSEAFSNFAPVETICPAAGHPYEALYGKWLEQLEKNLN
jgi:xylulokinase